MTGYVEAVQLLIEKGARVNEEVVRFLIMKGAYVDQEAGHHKAPLQAALKTPSLGDFSETS